MSSKSIGLKEALDIAQAIDWQAMDDLARAAAQYVPQVMAELDGLAVAYETHPETMRHRAVLFGITTPHRDESAAIAWAVQSEPWLDILAPRALAHRSYRSPSTGKRVQLGFYKSITKTLFHVTHTKAWEAATIAELETIPGVGPKVARMIAAVLDPHHPTWTVDIWHLRQLLWASDREYYVEPSVSDAAYKVFEAVWLEYKARFFADLPTFAVQWSTWCAADGRFVSHAALWADLASTKGEES